MTLNDLIEQLKSIVINDNTSSFGKSEVWADSDSEGYRFKIGQAFVRKYSGVTRIILQGD